MMGTIGRVLVLGATAFGFAASAGPKATPKTEQQQQVVKLSKDQLKQITAGKITQTNGGGKDPKGNAYGVPYKNPAGNEPGGWN